MADVVSIRRMQGRVRVNVARTLGAHRLHWMVDVMGPESPDIAAAIRRCRERLDMLAAGVQEADDDAGG